MSININNVYLYAFIGAGLPPELPSELTGSYRMLTWELSVLATGKPATVAATRRNVATAVTVLTCS